MDNLGIDYVAHKGVIKYTDEKSIERSYLPDFYIPGLDIYVDVKASFFLDFQRKKFENKKSNPDLIIFLISKNEFLDMGIDILKESRKISNHYKKFILN
jgi:hypothetical protein